MIKNKLFLLVVVGMFVLLLGNVSAEQQDLGTFKKDNTIQLIQICGNCTYNNITAIINPNGTQIILNAAMTRDDTYYYFNYPNTSILGEYIVNGFGNLDGVKTSWSYNFFISETGTELTTGKGIILLGSFITMIFMTILFYVLSVHVKSGLKFGFIGMSFIFALITIFYSMIILSDNFGQFPKILKSYNIFLYILLFTFLVIFILVLFALTAEALEEFKIKRGMKERS